MIGHFDAKNHTKQIQTDSDSFDGVLTSSVFDVTSYSNNVITKKNRNRSEISFLTF